MTYSIVARCSRTGQLGIGVASYSMAIGLYCEGAVRANTGVTLTQGFPNPRNNYLAINLLGQGHHGRAGAGDADTPTTPHGDYRQIAIVDRDDNAAIHSGGKLRPWAGHRIGKGCVAFGDGLAEAASGRGDGCSAFDATALADPPDDGCSARWKRAAMPAASQAPKGGCPSARRR